MSEGIRCPRCKTDLSDHAHEWLCRSIEDWVSRGVVSEAQADVIRNGISRADAPAVRASAPWRGTALSPSMALLLIGGILVVSAVVMVATELWEDLTPAGRFAIVAVPTLLFYCFAAILRARRMTSEWVSGALALIGACMAPFAVWLALGMTLSITSDRSMASSVSTAAGVGLVIQIATLGWFRSALLTVPPSVTLVWFAASVAEWLQPHRSADSPTLAVVILSGMCLMAAGQAFIRRGYVRHAVAPNAVGVGVAMLALTVLASNDQGLYDALSLAAPMALIIAACKPQFRSYLWAGAVFLVINTFRFGLSHFATTLGLPIAVMMCGLVTIVIGYVVHRVRNEYSG